MISAAPAMSGRPRLAARLSETSLGVTAITTAAIGRLTKKIQRQEARSVRMPESMTPRAAPTPARPLQIAIARARSCGRVNSNVSRERAAGLARAAPVPWTKRLATSTPGCWARPALAEASAKTARPIMNMRLRPSRSPIRPPSISSPP